MVGKLKGVRCGCKVGFEINQTKPLEALHDCVGECNGEEVIKISCSGVFGHCTDGGF